MATVQANVDFGGPSRAGQSVNVYNHGTQTLATIFDHDGVTSLANPVTVGGSGHVVFQAAPGTYDLVGQDLTRTVVLTAATNATAAPDFLKIALTSDVLVSANSDFYPAFTVVSSRGASATLDSTDHNTVHLAAGIWQIEGYYNFTGMGGPVPLIVFLDNWSPTTLRFTSTGGLATLFDSVSTADVISGPLSVLPNYQLNGAGTLKASGTGWRFVRLGDAP